MATFTYKAKSPTGEVLKGKMKGEDSENLATVLRNKGLYIMEIKETDLISERLKFFQPKVSTKEMAIFYKQFQTMLNSGITIVEALNLLKLQAKNPIMFNMLDHMHSEVQEGRLPSEIMAKYPDIFPQMALGMVAIGEVSGTLDKVLERLSIYTDKENKVNGKIKTAMVYPSIVGCVALLVVTFLMVFVVPNFIKMFDKFGAQLPGPTRFLIAIVNVIKSPSLMIPTVIIIILTIIGLRKLFSTGKGLETKERFIFQLPVIGDYVFKVIAYRFTRSLGELLKSGIALLKALDITARVMDNSIAAANIMTVRANVNDGMSLADALEMSQMFPLMVTHMIRVGEKSGNLDSMINKVADYYEEELDTSISRLITFVEPVMILVVAFIVGFIVIATVMPIFSIYSNIGK